MGHHQFNRVQINQNRGNEVGRRAKNPVTAREANGQPQRPKTTPPSEARRLRDRAAKEVRQSEYGTELGRLWLDDKVTPEMYEAGKKWVIVAVQRSMALQGPSANPRSLNIGSGGESHPIDPDSAQGEREAKKHLKAIQAYDSAVRALPRKSWAAIETVCERGHSLCGYQELLDLRCGLLILARHWSLDKSVARAVR